MVHADEGFAKRVSHRLRVRNADEQRADEAWANRHCETVNVFVRDTGAFERFVDDGNNLVEMFARCEFGNDAAEAFVNRNLRRDYGRQDLAAVAHERGRSFVTGGFDTEN